MTPTSSSQFRATLLLPQDLTYELQGRLHTFIREHHPFAMTFPVESLGDMYFVLVTHGEYWAALLWVHWVQGADKVLEVHAAAAPQYRGRWLTVAVREQLARAETLLQPRTVTAQVLSPRIGRLMQRLGFEIIGPLAVRKRDDNGNIQRAEGASEPDAAPGAAEGH